MNVVWFWTTVVMVACLIKQCVMLLLDDVC